MDIDREKPDLQIDSFQLWILEREFPDSADFWDGNWLIVRARCTVRLTIVEACGSFLHLSELQQWLEECKQINISLNGEAVLKCIEPNLGISLKMMSGGHCSLSISLSPDHMTQNHSFEKEIDQSYLPPLIKNLEDILAAYPLKVRCEKQNIETNVFREHFKRLNKKYHKLMQNLADL